MPDGSGNALIPSLPEYIQVVPGFLTREDDTWRDDPQKGWITRWRGDVVAYRDDVQAIAELDPDFRADEKLLCAADPKHWMALWGRAYEPRARKAQSKHVPFTPFAFQCHVMDWLVEIADNPEQYDGFITKSRGIGLSWTICAFAVWGWAFHDITTLLLSRTQSEVDKPNNMNTLFGKALYLIDNTPDWLLPEGFNRDRDRTQMNIYNPQTQAQIFGDSTTAEAGRGDRATIAFVDEAAFIRDLRDVWTTLAGTTDHVVSVSTESTEYGMTWVNTWENAKRLDPDSVFVLDWWVNPHQDEAWREREYKRREKNLDLKGYYLEVERNPWKGRTGLVYPEARTIEFIDRPFDASLPLVAGIDPGVVDTTAIIFGQPEHGDARTGPVNWLDSYQNSGQPAEFYAVILTGLYEFIEDTDVVARYAFSQPERDLMDWLAGIPWHRMRVVMDPAGKQVDSGMQSFQTRIMMFSKILRQRALAKGAGGGQRLKAIEPICEKIIALNAHQPRHNAARDLLARSTFHDTPGTRRLVRALQTYRMGELTNKATREPVPIHDYEVSDLATAWEWVAVYRGQGYLKVPDKPALPRADDDYTAWEDVA